jgi:hypothetical protein
MKTRLHLVAHWPIRFTHEHTHARALANIYTYTCDNYKQTFLLKSTQQKLFWMFKLHCSYYLISVQFTLLIKSAKTHAFSEPHRDQNKFIFPISPLRRVVHDNFPSKVVEIPPAVHNLNLTAICRPPQLLWLICQNSVLHSQCMHVFVRINYQKFSNMRIKYQQWSILQSVLVACKPVLLQSKLRRLPSLSVSRIC